MTTIKLVQQVGNRSVGIFRDEKGEYVAMTLSQSKSFRTLAGAEKWMAKRGR